MAPPNRWTCLGLVESCLLISGPIAEAGIEAQYMVRRRASSSSRYGNNPASEPPLFIHPSGEPYQHPKSANNAMILKSVSRHRVIESEVHLGNAGLNPGGTGANARTAGT